MENIAIKRIKRDFVEFLNSEQMVNGITGLEVINDNWLHLRANIMGPSDTPYEYGNFQLEIKVPETYPYSPPKVGFITHVWHPNVSSKTGEICLNILEDQWSPAMSLRTTLLSIQALLAAAEPSDPLDSIVAIQYVQSIEMFNKTAKLWTDVYARDLNTPEVQEFNQKMENLKNLGMEEHEARIMLSAHGWDVGISLDNLQLED